MTASSGALTHRKYDSSVSVMVATDGTRFLSWLRLVNEVDPFADNLTEVPMRLYRLGRNVTIA